MRIENRRHTPHPSLHQLGQHCLGFLGRWMVQLLHCSQAVDSLSWWLWPVYPTRPWGGAGVMGVGSSLGQESLGPASSLLALQLTY